MNQRMFLITFLFFAAFVPYGCAHGPNLEPKPDIRPGFGFCKLVENGPDDGKLIVTVGNFGDQTATPSTTKVEFSSGGSIELLTPEIPGHSSIDLLSVEIPVGCFDPDCEFTITVDSKDDVSEYNEKDNSGSGTCIG
jgi:hypothetical protein